MSVNASALDWYIREAVFSHLVPEQAADLLMDDESSDDKLKQFLDLRAAQQLRLDSLVDDYACGLLDRAEFVRAKSRVKAELSRINGEFEILKACSRETEILTFGGLLRRAWDANESITWRGALINRAIERIEVFPGIRKPFVNVDGVTMRFDKDRVKIIWRQKDGVSSPAA